VQPPEPEREREGGGARAYLPAVESLSSPNFFHLLRAMAGFTSLRLKAAVSILMCPVPKTPSVAPDLVGEVG
jgi:hypothetical protein